MGSETTPELPKIDFSGVDPASSGTDSWNSVRAQVMQAMESHGCFEAIYPQVSQELRESLFRTVVKELFALPLETKQRNIHHKPFHGYLGKIPTLDYYESLAIVDAPLPHATQSFANLMWPDTGNPIFCETVLSFSKKVAELEGMARRMLMEELGVDKYYEDLSNNIWYLLRFAEYLAPAQGEEKKLGYVPHRDTNTMSVVCQLQKDGLEVEGKDGEWILASPSPISFIVLAGNGFRVATEIFNKRKVKHEPDEKTYTILIYGWCKVNRHEMAQKFLKEMVDRGLEPNVVTYNVLLNGICRRASLHPDNRFDKTVHAAENLLDEMQRKGIEPDVTSYSIILHVYSRAHKPELSLCMLHSMKEKGICPTAATYTSVIKCLASCGRLEDAEDLLNEMASDGICPCPATYNCFFKEYRGRKDADSAIKLYKKMKEMGSLGTPDIHTFNILIGMFSKLNQIEIVRELWSDMVESNVGPDLDSYTLLIHGLCEKQNWREACQFFMEMIEKGFLPQKVTFETLYRGLIQSNMLRTWRRLKNKVEEESLKFGSEFQHYHLKPYKSSILFTGLQLKRKGAR